MTALSDWLWHQVVAEERATLMANRLAGSPLLTEDEQTRMRSIARDEHRHYELAMDAVDSLGIAKPNTLVPQRVPDHDLLVLYRLNRGEGNFLRAYKYIRPHLGRFTALYDGLMRDERRHRSWGALMIARLRAEGQSLPPVLKHNPVQLRWVKLVQRLREEHHAADVG